MSNELASLTGAYAVDALIGTELEEFERHLASCEDCVQEVAELRETAARLGADTAVPPPERLKQAVLEEITRTRQLPPLSAEPSHGRVLSFPKARRWTTRLAVAAAVIGIALAAAFGGLAWNSQQQLAEANRLAEQAGAHNAEVARLLQSPDASLVHGSAGDARAVSVVSRRMGSAAFLTADMPAAPADRTYQLWFIGGGGPRSAGVLPGPSTGEPLLTTMPADARQIAVTVEPRGGSAQPTTDPIMVMAVPT
ncbi:anti-sigma factor [Saccharopolyspora dendranthemae]|uniref:Regulator of SigK n=1 Tax=Saccharopolyspora dendranthemae TaxID=1181886 RepID=A0A561U0P7_9PSEU|nr:anti-sigma factor [Saccharopolyspora dendranthemae]TWF92943.1 anti-sigma-K factor RskA [Saccharopolyspora dendranthemae]